MTDYTKGVPQEELDAVLGKPTARNTAPSIPAAPLPVTEYSIPEEHLNIVMGKANPGKFATPGLTSQPASQPELPAEIAAELYSEETPVSPQASRSVWDAVAGGFQRGVAQVRSTVPSLQGIYAEYQGDAAEAEKRFQEAQSIQQAAPQSMQDFKEISGFEDAFIWGIEKFSEQIPVLGTAVLSGGTAGLIGSAVSRGLLSSVGARALATKLAAGTGGYVTTAGMETAGIGDEIRQATGNYHPGTALAGGLAAGALELATPLMLGRALFNGKQIASTVGKAALQGSITESATEAAQEAIAITARSYADPNFKVFSSENGWRILESAVAGGLVGGGVSAGAQGVTNISGERRGSSRKLSREEIEGWNDRPVSWLMDKVGEWLDPRKKELKEIMSIRPELDSVEAGVLLDTIGLDWIRAGALGQQADAIGRFIESQTSRYAHPLFPDRLLNSTDLEESLAFLPSATNPAKGLIEVNQGSLTPAAITAEFKDLPLDPSDARVFVMPGTTRQTEGLLRAEYDQLFILDAIQGEAKYRDLLNKGLRIIPSYGASFIYTSDLKGKKLSSMPKSQRYDGAGMKGGFQARALGNEVKTIKEFKKLQKVATTFDLNKLPPGTVMTLNVAGDNVDLNSLIFPKDMPLERQQELLDKITTINNVNAKSQFLLDNGVYSIPNVHSPAIYVDQKSDYKKAFATPIVATSTAYGGLNQRVEFMGQLTTTAPKDKPFELYVDPKVPPEISRYFIAAFEKLNEITKKMKLNPVKKLALYNAPIDGTADGKYRVMDASIKVNVNPTYSQGGSALYTLFHEFGHHVTLSEWAKLSVDNKQKIWGAYRRHLIGLNQDIKGLSKFLVDYKGQPYGTMYYSVSFEEYLTEQFVRWLVNSYYGMEQLPKLYGGMAKHVQQYYKSIASIDPKHAENLHPDYVFAQWMEYLKGDKKADFKPMRQLEAVLQMPNTHPLVERLTDILTKQLDANKDLFPSGWTVKVGDPGEGNVAVAISSKQVVVVSLAALEMGARRVLSHEAVHASRNLFTPQEWATLVTAANNIKGLKAQIFQKYSMFYKNQALQNNLSPEETKQYVAQALDEEAVASMIEMRATGMNFGNFVTQIIDKLLMFLERLATALQVELSWVSKERIISDFFKGEIAAREYRAELNNIYTRWLEQDSQPRVEGQEEVPDLIKKISPELTVGIYKERLENKQVYTARYVFYTKAPTLAGTKEQQFTQLFTMGQKLGVMYLSHNPKGFEVDYVQVEKAFRRQGWANKFYQFVEKDLKQAMKPSGLLQENGYKMWKARDPNAVRYHVYDAVDAVWMSPNYLKQSIQLNSTFNTESSKEHVVRYTKLLEKVNPKAWKDPELDQMFKLSDKGNFYGLGLTMATQARATEENVLTDGINPETGFEDVYAKHMQVSKNANEKLLNLEQGMGAPIQPEFRPMRNIIQNSTLTPQQKKKLYGSTLAEADRIGWFSKHWWGIKQLAWNNSHIRQLQSYTEIMEKWAAKTEQWIARADKIARRWDSEYKLSQQEKDGLAELLFYMTEMRYRSPQEVKNNILRRPTPAELQQAFATYKLGPRAQQLYSEIEGEFADFLTEVERISIESIQREFARQRVNGMPSAAEQKALTELAAEMAALRAKPYFPMTRFGEWTLTVRDPYSGQIEAFYTFESQKERNAYIQTAAISWAGKDLTVGRLPENAMDFVGLPGPMLRRIKAELPNLTAQQLDWLDQFGHHTAPEKSFRKRWLDRKEVPGYSLDAFRVFAQYFQSGAKYLSRLEFKDQAAAQIEDLFREAKSGLLMDNAKRNEIGSFMATHLNYMLEPGRDWGKVKSLIAIWHLGFSPIAAAMNLTQMPMITMPYLNALFGVGQTAKALTTTTKALKGSFGGIWRNAPWPGYEKGRQELIAQGKIDAGQAPELGAYASANNLYKSSVGSKTAKFLRTTAQTSMWAFGKAERINRELTYAMTFKLAMENPNIKYLQDLAFDRIDTVNDLMTRLNVTAQEAVAIIAAREAIDRTHGIYAPWARPKFLRNSFGATVLVFFQYVQMMLFALRNNPGAVQHLLMLTMLTGLMGLPGADDLDKLVEAVARRIFGKNWSPKNAIREYVQQVTEGTPYSKIGPDLLLHGTSRYGFGLGLLPEGMGIPRFDVSGNMSMGRIVPGLPDMAKNWGTYQDWHKGLGEAAQQASGAGYGVMFSMLQFLANDVGTSDMRKWEKIMPRTLKAQSKAVRYGVTGQETDRSGAWFASFDPRDPDDMATLVAQFLGANPVKLTQKWEAQSEIVETVMFYKGRKKVLYEQLLHAVAAKQQPEIQEVLKDIKNFNAEVRKEGFATMGINSQQVMSSLKNRFRSRGLKEQGLPAVRSEIPVWQRMQEQYPAVEWKKVK